MMATVLASNISSSCTARNLSNVRNPKNVRNVRNAKNATLTQLVQRTQFSGISLKKCKLVLNNRYPTKASFGYDDTDKLIHMSEALGHSITFGVAMYCTLQWSFYRNLRKQAEDNKKQDKKQDKKQ